MADLNNGSLAGQVPGVGLINALASAQADFATFETTNKAAVDALATTLKLTVAPGTEFGAELQAVSDAADLARENASDESDTGVLVARAATAATELTGARNDLNPAEKALAAKYDAAVAAEVGAKAGIATSVEHGAATGGLAADATATAAIAANGGSAEAVYVAYRDGSAIVRSNLDKAFAGAASYASFKAVVAKDAAYADAVKASLAAKDLLDLTPTDTTELRDNLADAQAQEAAARDALVPAADKSGVINALAADGTVSAALTAHGNAADLYEEYAAANVTQRGAIDTEFAGSAAFTSFKATVVEDVNASAAYTEAQADTLLAQTALNSAVAGSDTTGSAAGTAYVNAVDTKTAADKLVADAQAADTNKAAVDAIVKAYAAADTKVDAAGTALSDYNDTHTTTQTVALQSGAADSTVKEAFYFDSKIVASDDFTIGTAGVATTHFGTGDAIVLGTSLTYNSGALSTGDNNKSEFFLVQKGSDTLVVIETSVFGSSTTTHTATDDAALTGADSLNAAVITLTGVAVADLAVSNGVISYHAAAVA